MEDARMTWCLARAVSSMATSTQLEVTATAILESQTGPVTSFQFAPDSKLIYSTPGIAEARRSSTVPTPTHSIAQQANQLTATPAWQASHFPNTHSNSTTMLAPSHPATAPASPAPGCAPGAGSGPRLEFKTHDSSKGREPAGQVPDPALLHAPSWPSAPSTGSTSGAGADNGMPLLALSAFLQQLTPPGSAAPTVPPTPWTPPRTSQTPTNNLTPARPQSSATGTCPIMLLNQALEAQALMGTHDKGLGTALISTAGSDGYLSQTAAYWLQKSGSNQHSTNASSMRPHSNRLSLHIEADSVGGHAMAVQGRPHGNAASRMVKSRSAVNLQEEVHGDPAASARLGPNTGGSAATVSPAVTVAHPGSPAPPAGLFSVRQKLHNLQEQLSKSTTGAGPVHATPVTPTSPGGHSPTWSPTNTSTHIANSETPTGRANLPAWPQPTARAGSITSPTSPLQGPTPVVSATPHLPAPSATPVTTPATPAKVPAVYPKRPLSFSRSTSSELGKVSVKPAQVGATAVQEVQPVPQGKLVAGSALPVHWQMPWSLAPLGSTDDVALFSPSEAPTDLSEIETAEVHATIRSAMSSTAPTAGLGSGSSGDQRQQLQAAAQLHKQLMENGSHGSATAGNTGHAAFGSCQTINVGDTVPYPHTTEPSKVMDTAYHANPWQPPRVPQYTAAAAAIEAGLGQATGGHLSSHMRSTSPVAGLSTQLRQASLEPKPETAVVRYTFSGKSEVGAPVGSFQTPAQDAATGSQQVIGNRQNSDPGEILGGAAGDVLSRGSGSALSRAASSSATLTKRRRRSSSGLGKPVATLTGPPTEALSPKQPVAATSTTPMVHWLVAALVVSVLLLLMLNAMLLTMATKSIAEPVKV